MMTRVNKSLLAILLCGSLCAFGCGDDDDTTTTDSGPGGTDSGNGGSDSGGGNVDSGGGGDGGGMDDGGVSDGGEEDGGGGPTIDVLPCATQEVADGVPVLNLVVPDTLKINTAAPAGFPNGRRLADPVIDITLAVLLLDLSVHGADTFATAPVGPLNPPANDVAFDTNFPYLAAPHGTTATNPGGSAFDFRTDDPSMYTRVDRMGMPAVSTALVSAANKDAYNDDSPADDVMNDTGDPPLPKWAREFAGQLTVYHGALDDDLAAADLTSCAVTTGGMMDEDAGAGGDDAGAGGDDAGAGDGG